MHAKTLWLALAALAVLYVATRPRKKGTMTLGPVQDPDIFVPWLVIA